MGEVTTPLGADVVAKDGTALHLRAIRTSDAPALAELHRKQSEASRIFRFFAPRGDLSGAELRRFTEVDFDRRVALVATAVGADAPLLGMAGYDNVDEVTAEVAFYVADEQHGRGIGSLMLDHLAVAARERGYTRFVADVLPANGRMLAVFQRAGYAIGSSFDDGVITVELDLAPTEQSWRVLREREHHADALSMAPVLRPERIVRLEGLASGGAELRGALVVIDAAEAEVEGCLEAAGDGGALAAVVRSGMEHYDKRWHARVLGAARRGGLRLVGPGSFGIMTAGGENLTFEPRLTGGGALGVFTQGTLSAAEIAARFAEAGAPVASYVASGHRLDVSGNDVMQWWLREEHLTAAALCLDSIGNPRKFARIARVLARRMPVVCYIGSATGQIAPAGHSVAVSELPRAVLSGMLRQAGVIEVTSRRELVGVARLASAARRRPAIRVVATTPGGVRRAEAALAAAGIVGAHSVAGSDQAATAARSSGQSDASAGAQPPGELNRLPISAVAGAEPGNAADLTLVVDAPLPGQRREREVAELLAGVRGAALAVVPYPAPERLECASADVVVVDNLREAVGMISALTRPIPVESQLVAFDGIDRRALSDTLAGQMGLLGSDATAKVLGSYGIECDAEAPGLAVEAPGSPKRAIIEAIEDPLYGPVLSLAYGRQAAFLGDVAYRIAPLTWADIEELVHEPKSRPREVPALLRDVVGRVARLKDDVPRVLKVRLEVPISQGAAVHAAQVIVGERPRMDGRPRSLPLPFFE